MGISWGTLSELSNGSNNIAIGTEALRNSSGTQNTAIGTWAGRGTPLYSGSANVFIGFQSGANYFSPLNNQTELRKKICNYVNAKDRERNQEVQ